MSEVTIYGLPPSSYVRTARMICACKGVDHTLQPVDFRSEDYRRDHHPFGRMPAMEHGEVRLYECLAIGVYVDEIFDGPALQPRDTLGRAQMMQWVSVINDYVYDLVVGRCVAERFIKPMRGLAPDEEKIAAAVPQIAAALDVFERGLVGQDYLAGELSLSDLFLAPVLHYLAATPEGDALLPERVALSDWLARMRDTPDFEGINRMKP